MYNNHQNNSQDEVVKFIKTILEFKIWCRTRRINNLQEIFQQSVYVDNGIEDTIDDSTDHNYETTDEDNTDPKKNIELSLHVCANILNLGNIVEGMDNNILISDLMVKLPKTAMEYQIVNSIKQHLSTQQQRQLFMQQTTVAQIIPIIQKAIIQNIQQAHILLKEIQKQTTKVKPEIHITQSKENFLNNPLPGIDTQKKAITTIKSILQGVNKVQDITLKQEKYQSQGQGMMMSRR